MKKIKLVVAAGVLFGFVACGPAQNEQTEIDKAQEEMDELFDDAMEELEESMDEAMPADTAMMDSAMQEMEEEVEEMKKEGM